MEQSLEVFSGQGGVLVTLWTGVDRSTGETVFRSHQDVVGAIRSARAWVLEGKASRKACVWTVGSRSQHDFFINSGAASLFWLIYGTVAVDAVTQELIRDVVGNEFRFTDLGTAKLDKNVTRQVFQVTELTPTVHSSRVSGPRPVEPGFIGRIAELEEIAQAFTTTRWVTVVGGPGSGVTRLLERATMELWDEFADGVIRLNSSTLSPGKPVSFAVAQQLDFSWDPDDESGRRMAIELKDKSFLFLVDDALIHRADIAHFLTHVFEFATDCGVLASGPVWSIPTEHVIRLRGLSCPPSSAPREEICSSEAVTLMIENSEGVLRPEKIRDKDARALAQIAYQLDGNPFALVLAAGAIKLFAPSTLLNRLEDRFDLLKAPYHGSLRSRFDRRYEDLSTDGRTLLHQLSTFEGAFSLSTLREFLGKFWSDESELVTIFEELLDSGWCHPIDVEIDERIFALPINHRLFAFQKMPKEEQTRLSKEHFEWLRSNVQTLLANLGYRLEQESLEYAEALYGELRSLLKQLIRKQETLNEAGELILQLSNFWFLKTYTEEGLSWVNHFLSQKRVSKLPVTPRIQIVGAHLYYMLGESQNAIELSLAVVRGARANKDNRSLSKGLAALSHFVDATRPNLAWKFVRRAFKVGETSLEPLELFRLYASGIGSMPASVLPREAELIFNRALQLEQKVQDPFVSACARNNMAMYCIQVRAFGRARHLALTALSLLNDDLNLQLARATLRTLAEAIVETAPEVAARILGLVGRAQTELGSGLTVSDISSQDLLRQKVEQALGPDRARKEEMAGYLTSIDLLIEEIRAITLSS